MANGRAGKPDKRGNNIDRAARKMWLLSTPQFGGDGTNVECVHGCGTQLDVDTVEADRIEPGGSYRRNNIQPSCHSCNQARGNNKDWTWQPPLSDLDEEWEPEVGEIVCNCDYRHLKVVSTDGFDVEFEDGTSASIRHCLGGPITEDHKHPEGY